MISNRGFKSGLSVKLAVVFIIFLCLVAIFAPFLANDVPLYLQFKGKSYFPIHSGQKVLLLENNKTVGVDYKSLAEVPGVYAVYPFVPFSPTKTHLEAADYAKPGTKNGERTHFLGTNQVGEDTLAKMIHGTRVSVQVGVFSMLIALVLGLLIGMFSGYYGNRNFVVNRFRFFVLLVFLVPCFYYAFILRYYILLSALEQSWIAFFTQLALSMLILTLLLVSIRFGLKFIFPNKKQEMSLPIDNIIGRFIEFFDGLPIIILLISLSLIIKPSIYLLIYLIGFTGWIGIARYTRAEVLKMRKSDFMLACKVMGMPLWRVFLVHLLPNALGPAMVAFTFGVGSAIMVESSLSYLGIGIPQDIVTWGKILAEARDHFQAWWLVWFPGLAIFFLLLSVNVLGQYLRKRLNPSVFQP